MAALAHLLAAIGTPYAEIARRLECRVGTLRRHLGNASDLPAYSLDEILGLYDAYDTARNVAEVILSEGGSTEQARLRASLRAARSRAVSSEQAGFEDRDEPLSEEQICADLERLVGRPIRLKQRD